MTDNSNEVVLKNVASQQNTVNVKQEKIDLEVENRLKCLNRIIKPEPEGNHSVDEDTDSDSSDYNESEDEKKDIAPVKSSNEILAELFGVFNAAPPEELLDDKNLLKKNAIAKKVKKERKKKHKKVKSDGECSEEGSSEYEGKQKHKKKRKHKHKHKHKSNKEREKHKHRDVDKIKDNDNVKSREHSHREEKSKERERHKGKTKESERLLEDSTKKDKDCKYISRDRKRLHTDDDTKHAEHEFELPANKSSRVINEKDRDRDRAHNSFYNGYHERDEVRKEHQHNDRERHRLITKSNRYENSNNKLDIDIISDISLSDEETFLRERDTKSKRRNRDTESETSNRVHNIFYGSSNHRRQVIGEERNSDMGRHSRRQRNSRSRSRSRTPIDKKRLFEIARKNAITMVKHGKIPDSVKLSKEAREKLLMNWRYGGRSVDDLTEFCRKIANGESGPELSSDDGDSDVDKNGNAKAFNHPFQLKEREPIVMHIRNATTLVPSRKPEDATKAITMQFPVSSGQQHRMSEVWVPVEKNNSLAPLPTLPPAKQSTNIFKDTALPKNVFEKPIPIAEEQEPAFKPVGSVANLSNSVQPPPQPVPSPQLSSSVTVPNDINLNSIQAPSKPTASSTPITVIPKPANTTPTFIPEVPIPSTAPAMPPPNDVLFSTLKAPTVDVSSIITTRLNAIRRLQENPTDPAALKLMNSAQRDMSSWASSKHLPGQFTGSTGANIMKAHELNSGPQLWARRDQLTSTKPVTGGMGMALLQKMGWKPGEGLGPTKNGSLQPLLLDIKLDKRGLVSSEDNCQKQKQQQKLLQQQKLQQQKLQQQRLLQQHQQQRLLQQQHQQKQQHKQQQQQHHLQQQQSQSQQQPYQQQQQQPYQQKQQQQPYQQQQLYQQQQQQKQPYQQQLQKQPYQQQQQQHPYQQQQQQNPYQQQQQQAHQQQQQQQQAHQQQQQQQQQQQPYQQQQQHPSKRKNQPAMPIAFLKMQDKHPVCALNEITSKNKWTPPLYRIVNEFGPSHDRLFHFSVEINGSVYTPQFASNTKKDAKYMAAKTCLQSLGILPPDS